MRVTLALLVTVLVLTIAPAAPRLKEKPQTDLLGPTAVGTKWVFVLNGVATTNEITAIKEVDGGKLVTVERAPEGGGLRFGEVLRVSADGLALVEGPVGKRVDPPRVLLKLPAKAGDKWVNRLRDGKLTISCTVRGMEKIKVPAGEFEALRVDEEYDKGQGVFLRASSWYASGVGAVKHANDGTEGLLLKSFERGKE